MSIERGDECPMDKYLKETGTSILVRTDDGKGYNGKIEFCRDGVLCLTENQVELYISTKHISAFRIDRAPG